MESLMEGQSYTIVFMYLFWDLSLLRIYKCNQGLIQSRWLHVPAVGLHDKISNYTVTL